MIDVALTETARHAHYVLPAASQFEKWEATFFNLEFPQNVFQLRAPLFDPLPGTLAEPEIHRLFVRRGALDDDLLAPLHAAAAQGRAAYAEAFMTLVGTRQGFWRPCTGDSVRDAGADLGLGARSDGRLVGRRPHLRHDLSRVGAPRGFSGDGLEMGEALFEAMLARRSGVVFTIDEYEDSWRRLATSDGRVKLDVPELWPSFPQSAMSPRGPTPSFRWS